MPSSHGENSVTGERLLLSVLSNRIPTPSSLPTGKHTHTPNHCYTLLHTAVLSLRHTQADLETGGRGASSHGKTALEARRALLQPLAERGGGGGGSLGKWILFSDASTHVRGLTAHYSGPGPLCSPADGWQGLLGGGEGGWRDGRRPGLLPPLLHPLAFTIPPLIFFFLHFFM